MLVPQKEFFLGHWQICVGYGIDFMKIVNWETKSFISETRLADIFKTKWDHWKVTLRTECAQRLIPFSRAILILSTVCRAWPPIVLRRTWGLRRQTSALGMWYTFSSIWTESPFSSCKDQLMILSPATWFDKERSLIFILLSLYAMKSNLCGEMHTDAPESIIML